MSRPLNKREQKKLLRKQNEKKDRTRKTITTVLFFAGLFFIVFLFIYSHIQYSWTIIDYKIPFAIFIISGIVLGAILKEYLINFAASIGIKLQLFWSFFYAGAIVTALFFFLNNILAKPEIYSIEAPILETYYTSMKGGRNKGVGVDVDLHDFKKQLHFPLEDEDRIGEANIILLKVSKGGLGFEIIRDRIPME